MAERKPLWRVAFDAAERRVGPAAEAFVRTDTFADVVGAVSRINHRNRLRAEALLRDGWHRLNLPAGTDVRRLSDQVTKLERRVRDLQDQLDAAKRQPTNPPRNKETTNGQPRRAAAPERARRTGGGRRAAVVQAHPKRAQAPRRG
jgi:hypothetical protein